MRDPIDLPATSIPVSAEVDICVVGGSCTGVFAAVRAARLGAKVAIVERQGCFGGVATSSLVSIWHSLKDEAGDREIIGGMTREVIDRLARRDAVHFSSHRVDGHHLNTEELKIELDELVTEHGIRPYLNTIFSEPITKDGELRGVVIQTLEGRKAILAKLVVDATGDGRVARALGCEAVDAGSFQPPTMCAKIWGLDTLHDWSYHQAIREHGPEFGLEPDWGWGVPVPGLPGLRMQADCHVFNMDTADADDLTASEIEGRRKIRAVLDIIRKYGPPHSHVALADIAATIGVRETTRVRARHTITANEVLYGKRFDDAIANGSYRVDIHHDDGPGITFRYLDGSEVVIPERGAEPQTGRWREETPENPTFYQVPLRSIVPRDVPNLMLAGRMLDADKVAFSAVRVMVNMNQTGEAAGVTAYLSLDRGIPVQDVPPADVRRVLADGGSIIV
jgi:2-polyprenyl-6-methoxyphenol hydroxylase-like FAD-dependent oxidoreductase